MVNLDENNRLSDECMDYIYRIGKNALLKSRVRATYDCCEDKDENQSKEQYQALLERLVNDFTEFDPEDYPESITPTGICAMSAIYGGNKEVVSESEAEEFAKKVRENICLRLLEL